MSTADPFHGAADLDALADAARGFGADGAQPPAGLPDTVLLTKLANQFFAAVPGQSVPMPAGVSTGGFGASPSEVAGTSAPHVAAAATSSTPSSLPANVDAGPSLSGFGAGRSSESVDVPDRTSFAPAEASDGSVPQPPPVKPPPQVLKHHNGIDTPHSAGSDFEYEHIPLPFDSELKALLAPLAAEPLFAPGSAGFASPFYFLKEGSDLVADRGVSDRATPRPALSADRGFDINAVRRDFPILNETVNGKPLIWFDNAATTQKPRQVIERLAYFYEHENSNIHRAAHELAARATDAYEGARSKVSRFLNAGSTEEIIFTRGATEAINLVAATYGATHVGEGDEIVITHLEHHANIVPWQQLCLAKGAKLRVAPVDDGGALLLDEFSKLLNSRTKIVAFTQVANALGTITPAKTIVDMAHRVGARVLVDGAQSVSHMKVDVQDLDADFLVFSGHKLFAPTGIGALYAKKSIMDSLPPYQTGGNMIRDVTFERAVFHPSPMRFEAGTGNIADAVGLGAAIDYVERIGLHNIADYEHKLLVYATKRLQEIPNLRIIGTAAEKASVISLVIKGVPSEEIGAHLNKHGIAVRSGHHCAQPILRRFGQETTVRPSFAFYNTCGEIDVLVAALEDIQQERALARL